MTDLSHIDHLSRVTGPTAHPGNDTDPQETTEWIDALAGVLASGGPQRARFLLDALQAHAARTGLGWKPALTTPYVNSIAVTAQPPFPGDLELERELSALMRWNALAMVVRANRRARRTRRAHRELRLGGRSVRGRVQPFLPRAARMAGIWSTSSRTRRRACTRGPFSRGA
jgi:hypothetical protein